MSANGGPKNFSEALDDLEQRAQSAAGDYKTRLMNELKNLEEGLKNLSPHLEEAKKAQKAVEEKVQENPWAAVGIAALVAFFIGWLIGTRRPGRHD